MVTTFIGVDFAWQSERNGTGIAVARGEGPSAAIVDLFSGVRGIERIATAILDSAAEDTVVAVDAPLIINNQSGRRPCESEISRRFGAQHASAHSSNLTLYPEPATRELVRRLAEAGFRHGIPPEPRDRGRWFFEVYPHPAHIVVFGLDRIIQYKAKSGRSRSLRLAEFARLRSLLASLENAEPALVPGTASPLLTCNLDELRGQRLKDYEDALDAWFCAYLAQHAWYGGAERNEIVGDFESGYIVLPKPVKRFAEFTA